MRRHDEGYDPKRDQDLDCDKCDERGWMDCPECLGAGFNLENHEIVTCDLCMGQGKIPCPECG